MDTTTPLPHDFTEFLRLFNESNVEYLMIGGYAVVHHGYHRVTLDLDVWVNPTVENEPRIKAALARFGFDPDTLADGTLREPGHIIRMGHQPFRIEVHTSIAGVAFDRCSRNAVTLEIEGVSIRCIGRDDLIANKKAAGRHKDLADVEVLGRQHESDPE